MNRRWTQIYADGRWDEDCVNYAFLPVRSLAGESMSRQECCNTLAARKLGFVNTLLTPTKFFSALLSQPLVSHLHAG